MLSQNKNIISATRKFVIVFWILIVFQFIVLIFILPNFLNLITDIPDLIKTIFFMFFFLLFIIGDIIYCYRHILKRISLFRVKPRLGIIEDFIMTYYVNSNEIKYHIEPVIRDIETNTLYFTYSDYNLSYYTSVELKNNRSLINKQIIRKDGSVVNINDKVLFYVRKMLDVDVSVDYDKIYLKNGRKLDKIKHYYHVNEKYSIEDIKKFVFFEGIIEVENVIDK